MEDEVRRFVRFTDRGQPFAPRWGQLDSDGSLRPLVAEPWAASRATTLPEKGKGPSISLERCDLLAPAQPTKIVCVGRNYAAHAAELGNSIPAEPLLFLKPPSSLIGPGAAIELPPGVGEVHHEAELAVVIGRRFGPRDDPAKVGAAIAGLCCANDVTAREIQRREGKFTRAKGFDTFCAVGPYLVAGLDPERSRRVTCHVNGALRQEGETHAMITGVSSLLAFITRGMTLEPGDLVLTGTPPGVGPLLEGEEVVVEVEQVGVLANPVVAWPGR